MKIGILGAGAMGALVGAHLKKGGATVCFVDGYAAHMQAVAKEGLYMEIEGRTPERVFLDAAVTDAAAAGPCDIVVVLVKGPDTKATIEGSKALFGPGTLVLSLQNGMGNEEILREYFPQEDIGLGVLKCSATLAGPGRIFGRVKFPGSEHGLYFSPIVPGSQEEKCRAFEAALNAGGLPTQLSQKTRALMWDKLYINVMYNAPCALVQLAGEDCMRHPEGRKMLRELARELCEVATACGHPMDPEAYWEKQGGGDIDRLPADERHFTSTVRDVWLCKKTEVDFLNGAVVRKGEQHGVPTPYNRAVTLLLRTLEDSYPLRYSPDA